MGISMFDGGMGGQPDRIPGSVGVGGVLLELPSFFFLPMGGRRG